MLDCCKNGEKLQSKNPVYSAWIRNSIFKWIEKYVKSQDINLDII